MSLLPQKFAASKERTCRLLPANNRAPLVIYLWQIPVGLHFIFIKVTEQCLRCRTHTHSLLKWLQSSMCHPCNLRCKAFYVVFFHLKQTLRYKHWHVYILHACLFKLCVKLLLDLLPDRIAGRLDDHTSLDAGVVTKLRLFHYVCVPLCEILIHGSNRFHKFLVVCHFLYHSLYVFMNHILFQTPCFVNGDSH